MTLQQKLNDSIIRNINIVESENRMCYDYNHLELAENCEVIADEFAIEFAEWLANSYYSYNFGIKMFQHRHKEIYKTTKELLEICKKQKGL
jgi:hypothetical protein